MVDIRRPEMKWNDTKLKTNARDEFGSVRHHLEDQGCDCRFVSSYQKGAELLAQLHFDLILSSGQPGIRTIVPSLLGLPVSMFCAHAIEDSCLWLPVMLKGSECLGEPPLRPKEFTEKLGQILDEIGPHERRRTGAAHSNFWHR